MENKETEKVEVKEEDKKMENKEEVELVHGENTCCGSCGG